MHIHIDELPILVLSLFSTTSCVSSASISDDDSDYRNKAVLVGYGYSADSQQLTNQPCFEATVGKISDQTMRIELSSAVSTSNLQKTFGVDLSVNGNYGLFSADAKAEYLRSIQEDESSVSVNYYVVAQEKVTVNINGFYDRALTDIVKQAYHDEKLKKYFGLHCGDYYIASYNQGAVLFVGLNIILNSKEQKEKLEGSIGASYGSFANVAAKIQSVSNENKISGLVQVRAYQFGGEPSELTGIMSENIANCNINFMSECNKVIQDLLSYAKVFGNQIKNGKGLKALGSFDYIPIERLGLTPANSLVTPEILQSRKDLAIKLNENRYYARRLLLDVMDPVLMQDAKPLLDKAKQNIEFIMDPKTGAVRCFNTPEKCEETKTQIYENLNNITNEDMNALSLKKFLIASQIITIMEDALTKGLVHLS